MGKLIIKSLFANFKDSTNFFSCFAFGAFLVVENFICEEVLEAYWQILYKFLETIRVFLVYLPADISHQQTLIWQLR